MGLMLSVLVFCVGVAEVLDCWRHFLLHLVQPQYNPIPFHLDSTGDILCEEELNYLSESRRTSHADICWPKDLSSTDDLHVIKRRTHSDCERSCEHDGELGSLGHCEHDTVQCESSRDDDLRPSCPQITVHCPETSCYKDEDRPLFVDTSSNHLELSVIIESDSSSEVDEPSQIENISYKKEDALEPAEIKKYNEFSGLCESKSAAEGTCEEIESELLPYEHKNFATRPTCPTTLALENANEDTDNVVDVISEKPPINILTKTTLSAELPEFTDNILSQNAQRVSFRHPSDDNVTKDKPYSCDKEEICCAPDGISKIESDIDASDLEVSNYCTHSERNKSFPNETNKNATNTLSIDALLDEGLEPIQEYPEIRLFESSPVSLANSSESSVNTSDASWMAKSRTSDRPLMIRFTPEEMAKEFMSVTEVDLKALGNKIDSKSEADSVELHEDAEVKDEFFDAQGYPEILQEVVGDGKKTDTSENATKASNYTEGIDGCVVDGQRVNETDVFSVNILQPDTNSSSSSLSGIPQLPEDTKESLTHTPLPTDNGYGKLCSKSSGGTAETSDSGNDKNIFGQSATSFDSSNTRSVAVSFSEGQENCSPSDYEAGGEIGKLVSEDYTDVYAGKTGVNNGTIVNIIQTDESNILKKDLSKEANSEKRNVKTTLEGNSKGNEYFNPTLVTSQVNPSEDEKILPKPVRKDTFKKRKTKLSAELSTPTSGSSEEIVKMFTAKESDEEGHVGNQAEAGSVRTSLPVSEIKTPVAGPSCAQPGPSTSASEEGAVGSTVKGEHPEDKAFWLIFSGEYTKAMNKDWHSGHFCCWQCDESLTGQRYVLRDEHPYCIKCYETVFANGCEECSKTIGIDSKDLSYKDKHWHEACFLCNKCRVSLVDKQFGSKLDKIFCGNCYDAQFASRCDGCGQIFKAGTKKMEYKTRQWHEPCFSCCVCKSPIGTKSFIPREQEIYCATCYEEKFATRCVKCNKIITSGGVTYKNEPWHRECFTCTNCNTSLAGQRFTSRDEKPYCAECFGELFAKRCTACCKPITGIGGTRFISFEDRHWHNDCFICASCKTSLVGRGFITDGDDIICPECAKQKLM